MSPGPDINFTLPQPNSPEFTTKIGVFFPDSGAGERGVAPAGRAGGRSGKRGAGGGQAYPLLRALESM
jgi:hypothetical protein